MSVTVTLAENADGEAIKAILSAQGPFDATIPFDNLSPFWLIARIEGRGIVGCIQTCLSRPIASLEMLGVAQSLSEGEKGQVVRELLLSGCAVLCHHGATHVRGFVPFELKGYKRVLKKRGAVVADSGNLMLRRIA